MAVPSLFAINAPIAAVTTSGLSDSYSRTGDASVGVTEIIIFCVSPTFIVVFDSPILILVASVPSANTVNVVRAKATASIKDKHFFIAHPLFPR